MTDKARPGGFTSLAFHPQNRDAAVLRATTELFVNGESRSRDEIRRYEELATHFLGKVGLADRAFVAETLAPCEDAPASVLRMLGKDLIEVAAPILSRSPALTNLDFLMIIAATGPLHHRMIARRKGLPEDVAEALGMSSDAETAAILAAKGAERSQAQRRATAAAAGISSYRPDPRPVESAGDPFRPSDFLALNREGRLRVLAELSRLGVKAPPRSAPRSLDRSLRAAFHAGQLVGQARKKESEALIKGIAEAVGLDPFTVKRMIEDSSGEALVVLLKTLALGEADVRTLLLLVNPAIGKSTETFFRLVDLHDAMESDVAEAMLAAWRGESLTRTAGHRPHFSDAEGVRTAAQRAAEKPAAAKAEERRKA